MGEMPVNSGKIAGTTYIYDEARRLMEIRNALGVLVERNSIVATNPPTKLPEIGLISIIIYSYEAVEFSYTAKTHQV